MDNRELYHFGVKGMKWGVRRYQNKDGSLTAAGKKRMYKEMYDMESKERKEQRKYTADANRWSREDMERSKRLAESTSHMTNDLKRINDNSIRKSKSRNKNQLDLSSMSDKEMRDAINRAYMEKQYNELFAPQKEHKGREFASSFLETTGNVVSITAGALGIALAYKQLKGD